VRVVHVSAYFAPAFSYGGPPRSILGLCQALREAGVELEVLTTTANGAGDLAPSPLAGDTYGGVPVRYLRRSFPKRFFGVRGLADELDGTRADLLHLHGLWNVPVWTAARWARRRNVPYVLSPRGMLDRGSLAHRSLRKRIAYGLVERRNLSRAALLHATSDEEARSIASRTRRADVLLLRNGVSGWDGAPLEPKATHRRLGLPAERKLIVYLGRLHAIKRLDLLAEAFRLVRAVEPSAHLVIAGPGNRQAFEPLFQKTADAVSFLGETLGREKWELLAAGAALVLCSESESFGMSVAEALLSRLPVVVTRTCPWEDVERHRSGLWVPHDASAIAHAVLRILGAPEEAAAMGRRGRALIEAEYGWKSVALKMADAYARVLEGRGNVREE